MEGGMEEGGVVGGGKRRDLPSSLLSWPLVKVRGHPVRSAATLWGTNALNGPTYRSARLKLHDAGLLFQMTNGLKSTIPPRP